MLDKEPGHRDSVKPRGDERPSVEAKRSAPSDPSWPSQRSVALFQAVAESSVRDTALGGDAGEAERSVGGYGGQDFFHLKVLAFGVSYS
jgi:hypothetical protein